MTDNRVANLFGRARQSSSSETRASAYVASKFKGGSGGGSSGVKVLDQAVRDRQKQIEEERQRTEAERIETEKAKEVEDTTRGYQQLLRQTTNLQEANEARARLKDSLDKIEQKTYQGYVDAKIITRSKAPEVRVLKTGDTARQQYEKQIEGGRKITGTLKFVGEKVQEKIGQYEYKYTPRSQSLAQTGAISSAVQVAPYFIPYAGEALAIGVAGETVKRKDATSTEKAIAVGGAVLGVVSVGARVGGKISSARAAKVQAETPQIFFAANIKGDKVQVRGVSMQGSQTQMFGRVGRTYPSPTGQGTVFAGKEVRIFKTSPESAELTVSNVLGLADEAGQAKLVGVSRSRKKVAKVIEPSQADTSLAKSLTREQFKYGIDFKEVKVIQLDKAKGYKTSKEAFVTTEGKDRIFVMGGKSEPIEFTTKGIKTIKANIKTKGVVKVAKDIPEQSYFVKPNQQAIARAKLERQQRIAAATVGIQDTAKEAFAPIVSSEANALIQKSQNLNDFSKATGISKNLGGAELATKNKSQVKIFQSSAPKLAQTEIQIPKQRPIVSNAPKLKQPIAILPSQRIADNLAQGESQVQKNLLRLRQPERIKTGFGYGSSFIFRTPKYKVPRPFIFPSSTISAKSKYKQLSTFQSKSAFEVFVRRKGKDVLIAQGLPYGKATRFGAEKVLKTLAASFTLRPRGTTTSTDISYTPSSNIFRPSKTRAGYLVQKRGARLSSKSEVFEILRSKRSRMIT